MENTKLKRKPGRNAKRAIIGLKELRIDMMKYIKEIEQGKSFIIVKRSKPIFKISPITSDRDIWQ